ncbi:hypothetical protein [Atopococcus tabaci]|uniref:hypothetical protein n=1 Tax=Atopococcus tabaci TaxID=269774 RepID=UPI000403B054|nr:hypothetical protein [Atopococcus tabaci]
MISEFDEYQKFLRYKYGYHSFGILFALLAVNHFVDYPWAQSTEEETMILASVVANYFVVRLVFGGAYYGKRENPVLASLVAFVPGLLHLSAYLTGQSVLFENGRLADNAFVFFSALFWMSIPITYVVRAVVDKIRERKEDLETKSR